MNFSAKGCRIGWLDSADMPSRIHLTLDEGNSTICGHHPKNEQFWKIVSDGQNFPRKKLGRSNYCKICFKLGGKSLPFYAQKSK